jgi:hypothetical protein
VVRLGKWARRRPAIAGLLATLFAAVALGFGLVLWQLRRAEDERRLAEWEREQTKAQKIIADNRTQSAETRLAENYLDRGLAYCHQEQEAVRGMLWMCRALRETPASASDLESCIRMNLAAWRDEIHPLQTLVGHQGTVNALAISTDGTKFLTSSDDHTVRLWEAHTGKPLGPALWHTPSVVAVSFAPDGQKVLVATDDGVQFGYGTPRRAKPWRNPCSFKASPKPWPLAQTAKRC